MTRSSTLPTAWSRAVLPQRSSARAGKIVVVGSASAMRGTATRTCYGAARGAQHAYVKNVGIEVAPHNVQVNATGQIFVENPTYFPPGGDWKRKASPANSKPYRPAVSRQAVKRPNSSCSYPGRKVTSSSARSLLTPGAGKWLIADDLQFGEPRCFLLLHHRRRFHDRTFGWPEGARHPR